MAEFYSASLDRLLNVMLELKQKDELYAFLSELCSAKELRDLSVRLEVCLLLQEGLTVKILLPAAVTAVCWQVIQTAEKGTDGMSIEIGFEEA